MRSNASPDDVVAVLAAASLEAAWITLLYVVVGSLSGEGLGPLTIVAFAGAALVGLGYARWAARDEGRAYRTPLAVLVVVAAIVGWLAPLGADAIRVFDSPTAVIQMHPGGILLGLAVLRGAAHVKPEDDERIAAIALGPGLGCVAAAWVALTLSGGTKEPATVDPAFAATVTFVASGLLSMGLARLTDLRDAGGLGADRRTWTGVLVGVIAATLAVAIPLALVLGVPLDHAIRGALGPIGSLLVPLVTLLLTPFALLGSLIVMFIRSFQTGPPADVAIPDWTSGLGIIDWTKAVGQTGVEAAVLGLVPIVVAIVVTFLLIRRFLGQPVSSRVERDVIEIRETEGPADGVRLRLPRLPASRRQPVPRTASEAYLASLDVLAPSPELARLGSETPAEHARRLRADPVGPPLARLAAAYALVEFGGRTLPMSEHRRAVERWRRLRSTHDRPRDT